MRLKSDNYFEMFVTRERERMLFHDVPFMHGMGSRLCEQKWLVEKFRCLYIYDRKPFDTITNSIVQDIYEPRHFKLVEIEKLGKNRFPIFGNIKHVTLNNLAGFSNTTIRALIHRY